MMSLATGRNHKEFSFLTQITQIFANGGGRFNELSSTIIGSAFEVANVLGRGFVEKVYANALSLELEDKGVKVRREVPIKVYYKMKIAGDFFFDLFVDEAILVETKATGSLNNLHIAQCLNYLKASGLSLCLLINFGSPSVQVKRIVNNF
jgi:GxxExxY protein